MKQTQLPQCEKKHYCRQLGYKLFDMIALVKFKIKRFARDKHPRFHLCICLNIGGNWEGLNTGCSPGHMNILCQASC